MHSKAHSHSSTFGLSWSPASAALAILLTLLFLIFIFLFIFVTVEPAQGQTYTVLHSFTGGVDGATPSAGLTMDAAGNLYGTTLDGGSGYGTVFKLTRKNSGWFLTRPYSFQGGSDGASPAASVIFGPDGNLYGTTLYGGGGTCGQGSCGTAFELHLEATVCSSSVCPWPETVLHRFTGDDGGVPHGSLVFDTAGNIYGTTSWYGALDSGTVFELIPSGGGWTESVLWNFMIGTDGGAAPQSGVILDAFGNLYGTTYLGGHWEEGTIFQLMRSGSGWVENVLYPFYGGMDGNFPVGGLIFDRSGNLYGTASVGGEGGGYGPGGTVDELTSGNWDFVLVYAIPGSSTNLVPGPQASLTMDASGNLYGTTTGDGATLHGNVFRLSPSNGGWTYTSLYDFTGGSDGAYPISTVTLGADGNLYGTASAGGSGPCKTNGVIGCGVVWEIVP
ncbi:MAG: choice-of-anchor tandem repeat GloVer-containing protein [Candidatus Sulfotelmatobacter sp.]